MRVTKDNAREGIRVKICKPSSLEHEGFGKIVSYNTYSESSLNIVKNLGIYKDSTVVFKAFSSSPHEYVVRVFIDEINDYAIYGVHPILELIIAEMSPDQKDSLLQMVNNLNQIGS
jgi:hypothetical protein